MQLLGIVWCFQLEALQVTKQLIRIDELILVLSIGDKLDSNVLNQVVELHLQDTGAVKILNNQKVKCRSSRAMFVEGDPSESWGLNPLYLKYRSRGASSSMRTYLVGHLQSASTSAVTAGQRSRNLRCASAPSRP